MNNLVEKPGNNDELPRKGLKKASTAELPMIDLETVLDFVNKIEANGLQTLSNVEVSKKMGFAAPTSTPFYRRMASAKLFGLLDTTQGVNLTRLALDYFKPTDEESKRATLIVCLRSVVAYKKILDRYSGKRLPQSEIVGNLIEREFHLTPEAAKGCANVFLANVQYAGCVLPDGTLSMAIAGRAPVQQTGQSVDVQTLQQPEVSADSESHFLTLDAKKGRRVMVQGPPEITASELKRIQSWLAVQLHVVDALEGNQPEATEAPNREQKSSCES